MSDIKTTLINLTKNLTKSSGELVKTTKLNIELANEESNLKELYIEIGKKVQEIYTYGGSLGKYFDEKYLEIQEVQLKLDSLKKQIDAIKGVKICQKCGKDAARIADFCPGCGLKFDDNTAIPATAAEQSPDVLEINGDKQKNFLKEVKKCSACGADNDVLSRFCLSCGRVI